MNEKRRKDIEKRARFDAAGALDGLRADIFKATPDDLQAIYKPQQAAYDAIMKAVEDYWQDLARRRAAIDRQAQALDEQIEETAAALDDLENQARTAASNMDLDTAADYEAQAEPVRAELDTLRRKRKVIDSAELKGDPEIYQRLTDAQERLAIVQPICDDYAAQGRSFIQDAWSRIRTLHDKAAYIVGPSLGNPTADYFTRKVDDVVQHFHGRPTYDERKKLEAQERAQAWKEKGIIWG